MASAADIPHRYDITINGEGYVLLDSLQDDANTPRKGVYTYTSTFIPRSNTGAGFGDNEEEFWFTFAQRDWSLGEGQRHATAEAEGSRRFWRGSAVDITKPGEVSMRPPTSTVTFAAAVRALADAGTGAIFTASSTNLYSVNNLGTISDHGAHGLGLIPSKFGIVTDQGFDAYLGSSISPTVGIRKRTSGNVFSTFSANGADSLAFLNNTLYGLDYSGGTLVRYNSAGTQSVLHTWQGSDGAAVNFNAGGPLPKIEPFGGKLLILASVADDHGLWVYDGVGVSLLHRFPTSFVPVDMCVSQGVVFIAGNLLRGNVIGRPMVFYYANGSVGALWRAEEDLDVSAYTNNAPAIAPMHDGVVWTDDTTDRLLFYNPATGGVQGIGTYTSTATSLGRLASSRTFLLHARNQTASYSFLDSESAATSAYVTSSLVDFDSSLTKVFRGIKVLYDEASDGDGGSIDIAYRLEDVDGAYTTLQTGAVSGTEYNLSDITGRSISIKITLNKGTSTLGPVLKRVYVRAVPSVNNYERFQVTLNCTGRDKPGLSQGPVHIYLRNDTRHGKTGLEMAQDLRTAASSTTPIEVATKFGTISNAIIENLELIEIRPEEFVATVTIREV